MRTETATKKITQSGDSLVINVTKEVKRLGLDRGDTVDVTLSSERADTVAFLNRIITNAIKAHDLPTVDGLYCVDYTTLHTIADSVADCCGGYDIGINQMEYRFILSVFDWDPTNTYSILLAEVEFIKVVNSQ